MAKRVPIDEAATAAEVRQALDALTDQETLQVEKYAKVLSFKLEESQKDLFNQTMASIRNPELGRRWRKATVPFMAFLVLSLKGEASNLYSKKKRQPKLDGSKNAQVRLKSQQASVRPAGHRLQEDEMMRTLTDRFKDDRHVLVLIDGISLGLSRAQIIESGVTANEYAAAMTRFKRGAIKLFEQEKLTR